jgi:hypothetical protein
MQNDSKDRHVLACAVQSGARLIVTFNVRHFPSEALDPWLIEAQHPDDFLMAQYRRNSETLALVLREQAQAIGWETGALLQTLRKSAPRFVQLVSAGLLLDV